jgi:hypothetical protein
MQFVAYAPTRAASTLMWTPVELSTGVEMSLDAARASAYATDERGQDHLFSIRVYQRSSAANLVLSFSATIHRLNKLA